MASDIAPEGIAAARNIRPMHATMTTQCRGRADDDPANPGGFPTIVAIADVARRVKPGSVTEAQFRGNSVYFADPVVPMLPERIFNDALFAQGKEETAGAGLLHGFRRVGHQEVAPLRAGRRALGGKAFV